jgi:recombination DNA repair RAD52 pathway protein
VSDIRAKLDATIPEGAVESREQGGKKLSYLSGAYVIRRMNEVFGQGNWSYSIQKLEKVFEGKVEQRSGEVYATSYIAEVEVSALFPDSKTKGEYHSGKTYFTDVGYGDGTDRNNPGKAHELAVKEAVTDGIKRAAKNLGISMGLGLYFKGGEYVTDTEEVAEPAAPKAKGKETDPIPIIGAAYNVLIAQGKVSKDVFTTKYLKGNKLANLTNEAAYDTLNKLKSDFPELNLN